MLNVNNLVQTFYICQDYLVFNFIVQKIVMKFDSLFGKVSDTLFKIANYK